MFIIQNDENVWAGLKPALALASGNDSSKKNLKKE